MKNTAKVSIVIPVYNGSNYLDEAIQSALRQTYLNTEILVVNDGSEDGGATDAIASKYQGQIRYFNNKKNGGVASALNMAIEEMEGDYFSWLSHDDLYLPDKIESQVTALSAMEGNNFVSYCDYSVFTDDPRDSIPIKYLAVPPSEFRFWLTTNNILHGCTLLIPRSAFNQCGKFATNLHTTQDYDLWFRMASHFQFVHLPRSLVLARRHPEQDSLRKSGLAKRECNELLFRFSKALCENEIFVHERFEMLSVKFAELTASMFRRDFVRAGLATIPLAVNRLQKCGMKYVLIYFICFPSLTLIYIINAIRSAVFRRVLR